MELYRLARAPTPFLGIAAAFLLATFFPQHRAAAAIVSGVGSRVTLILVGGVVSVVVSLFAGAAVAADRQSLLEALRGGGYVLYFRHAQTNWSQADSAHTEDNFASCDPDRMRQLSAEGRETARAVGAAIRGLGIPVSSVHASVYCRCVQTAELLDLGPVETTRDILNAYAAEVVGGREVLARTARRRLSTPPPEGTNTVLVGHGNVFVLVADTRPPEAGAAIVRPEGDGRFAVLAVWSAEIWIELAADRPASM